MSVQWIMAPTASPIKRSRSFRKWITDSEIDNLLATGPAKVGDKLIYEFGKIADRIGHLKKKHS
jgi:hypothetical protein